MKTRISLQWTLKTFNNMDNNIEEDHLIVYNKICQNQNYITKSPISKWTVIDITKLGRVHSPFRM